MRPYDAVTFDHWNTLVYEDGGELRGRRIGAWLALLAEAGVDATQETVTIAFESAWDQFLAHWAAGRHYDAAEAAGLAVDALATPIDAVLRARMTDAFVRAGEGLDFHLAEGIEECLVALKDAGVKLGIVCDVGFTPSTILRDHLDRRGILRYFDGWSFSDEVGVYKPEREIFEHALATVGKPEPHRVAHVGDLRRTDIAGANAMGMTSVRYTGVFDDDPQNGPEADVVVKHHLELPRALGL